uniref:Uncharacterized protein n=1 Tax=Octopus bimaculoides TaxID=37653 RepID=A0A0L8HVN3_OCTBM
MACQTKCSILLHVISLSKFQVQILLTSAFAFHFSLGQTSSTSLPWAHLQILQMCHLLLSLSKNAIYLKIFSIYKALHHCNVHFSVTKCMACTLFLIFK